MRQRPFFHVLSSPDKGELINLFGNTSVTTLIHFHVTSIVPKSLNSSEPAILTWILVFKSKGVLTLEMYL